MIGVSAMLNRRNFLTSVIASIAGILGFKTSVNAWEPKLGDLVKVKDLPNFWNSLASGTGTVIKKKNWICHPSGRQCNKLCKHNEQLFSVDFGLTGPIDCVPSELEQVKLEQAKSKHDWWVYSTVLDGRAILVECRNTGQRGSIIDPTNEEWKKAFHAPSNPYPWPDATRVVSNMKDDVSYFKSKLFRPLTLPKS